MNLENLEKVERILSERKSIVNFKNEFSGNTIPDTIIVNDIEFKSPFLFPIYSKEFVKEINEKILSICEEYIQKIDNDLSKL